MRGQFQECRWMEAVAGDYDIPAFGLVQITGATWEEPGRTVLSAVRPTNTNCQRIAINSWKPIAASDYGLVTCEGPSYVLYDTADTPAIGQEWGPEADSFKAAKGKCGLIILGAADTTRGIVLVNVLGGPGGLVGGCLAQNHPGRGVAFNIHLGTWNAADASGGKWVYEATDTVKAIDWRYAVPYPDEGSTGLFEPRPSDTYGVIYECVALDCLSPGACNS